MLLFDVTRRFAFFWSECAVQRALVAVNEANAAHTSRLEEALARCSTLEAALAAQTQAILDLNAKCDMNVSVRRLDKG